MDNIQNCVQIQVDKKIMQSLRQNQLQYKTKIIQLQKQIQYETNRANQFQRKFKQALPSPGADIEMDLVEKLSQKQNQNNGLRMQILKLKKRGGSNLDGYLGDSVPAVGDCVPPVDDSVLAVGDSVPPVDDSVLAVGDCVPPVDKQVPQASTKQLLTQNQQMARTIQQLKAAAISAIISKDDQIQQLSQKLSKAQLLGILYQKVQQREQTLQRQIQHLKVQSQQQQRCLCEKIGRERERYLAKLEEFRDNLHYEEQSKQQLISKAQSLESNLEDKQQIIQLYQNKLNQYQSMLRQQRKHHGQGKQKLTIQIDNLKDRVLLMTKDIAYLQKRTADFKCKEKQARLITDRLKDQNSELHRKITIKKRKNNPKLKSSDIYSSFEGISQKSSFYSSFYRPTQPTKPTTLGQIQQLQENILLGPFIDLVYSKSEQKIQQTSKYQNKKNKQVLEVDISHIETTQLQGTQTQRQGTQAPNNQKQNSQIKQQFREIQRNQNQQKNQTKHITSESERQSEARTNLQTQSLLTVQIQKLKNILTQTQNSLQTSNLINYSLKQKLKQAYSQLQLLNKQILVKTQQIQKERQTLTQLRTQNKKSQGQKQLIFQLQNFKQHIYKLQNALLIEKLQNAQKQQFMRERNERQKKANQEKISKLNEEMRNLSPKKKKGFF